MIGHISLVRTFDGRRRSGWRVLVHPRSEDSAQFTDELFQKLNVFGARLLLLLLVVGERSEKRGGRCCSRFVLLLLLMLLGPERHCTRAQEYVEHHLGIFDEEIQH